jgi:hypothetical protein
MERPSAFNLPIASHTLSITMRKPLGWLIHDQAVRIDHWCATDGEHLLLAAGKRLGPLTASLGQAREQRLHPLHLPAMT